MTAQPHIVLPEYRDDEYATPAEVAAVFRVDAKTVTRWAKAGRIASIRTLGGHRRYSVADVRRLVQQGRQEQVEP